MFIMNLWPFVHFFALIAYLFTAVFVLWKNPRLAVNRVCAATILCFALWSLQMTVLTAPGAGHSTALFFVHLASLGWLCFTPFLLYFVAILTQRPDLHKKPAFRAFLVLGPAAGFAAQLNGLLVADVIYTGQRWAFVWSSSFAGIVFVLICALYVGPSLFLLVDFLKKKPSLISRKRARIMLWAVITSSSIVAVSNLVLNPLGIATVESMASIMGLVWVFFIAFAVARYHFLTISPAMAAANILATMADMVILCDSAGRIVTTNRACLQTLGYPQDFLKGKPVDILFFEAPPDESQTFCSILCQDNVTNLSTVFSTQGKQAVPVLLTSSLLTDEGGQSVGAVLVARDMRDLRQAKKALFASEEKYRQILENMDECYFEVDVAGTLTFFNDAVVKLLGYSRQEMEKLNFKAFTKPHDAKRLFATFHQVYTTGEPQRLTDYTLITKGGAERHMESSIRLIRDSEGRIQGFSGLARDVTEKRLAQEEKRTLEERLTQAQKLEAVGTLAGGVAHDFNNLLMSLSGNVSIMLLTARDDDPIVPRLKEMERCVRRGADMTRRLLAFSRKGIGRPRPIDINALLLETASMFGRTHKDVSVNLDLAPDLAAVEADPSQMEQVFLNLFLNAGQAMPRGGVLTVITANEEPEKTNLACSNSPARRRISIRVSDTGCGMSEEVKARIFEPFFSTKPMSQGTGLGLFSAYGIISNHGGTMEVASAIGQGAAFVITLPACEKPAEISDNKEETPLYGRETILLVDDEQMVLQATTRMLEALGYTVIQSSGGREAVDIYSARAQEIDLVILDMVMPDMHGSETYRWLALMNPTVRVLLATGYSANGEAAQILAQGCDGFIQKPFDIPALSRMIRKILDQEENQASAFG